MQKSMPPYLSGGDLHIGHLAISHESLPENVIIDLIGEEVCVGMGVQEEDCHVGTTGHAACYQIRED